MRTRDEVGKFSSHTSGFPWPWLSVSSSHLRLPVVLDWERGYTQVVVNTVTQVCKCCDYSYKQEPMKSFRYYHSHSESDMLPGEEGALLPIRSYEHTMWCHRPGTTLQEEVPRTTALSRWLCLVLECLGFTLNLTDSWSGTGGHCLAWWNLLISWSYDTKTTQVLADGKNVKNLHQIIFLYDRISGREIKLKHSSN